MKTKRVVLGIATLILVLGSVSVSQAAPVLYASDASASQLYTLDPSSTAATLVGSYGITTNMGGLAYDPLHDILFGSDVTSNNLFTINQSTGAATVVGPFGVGVMQAMAFDQTTGNLYGAYGSGSAPSLYQINPLTGTATLIGGLDRSISGLSFDPLTHVLYGSSTSIDNPGVVTINPLTGQLLTQVSASGFNGISFDPTSNILYGVSSGGNVFFGGLAKGLYTINKQTGTTSLVGSLSLTNPLDIQFALRPVSGAAAPEPASALLFGPGVLLLMGSIVRRRSHG